MFHKTIIGLGAMLALLGAGGTWAAPLTCGVAVTATCGDGEQAWTFSVAAERYVLVGYVGTNASSPGTARGYLSDCTTAVPSYNLPPTGDADGEVLGPGTYCLRVPCDEAGATYQLEFAEFDHGVAACDHEALSCDGSAAADTINGSVTEPVEMFDSFTFVATPGDTLTFVITDGTPGDIEPSVQLYGPNGLDVPVGRGPGTYEVVLPAGPACATGYSVFVWMDSPGTGLPNVTAPESYAIALSGCSAPPGFCGDGIVQSECNEQCDLGAASAASGNCPAEASPPTCTACTRSCSSECHLVGRCTDGTTVGGCCTTAADCPAGQGCCGNGVTEGPAEACDDGNLASADDCTPQCRTDTGLPLACCPRGAEIAGATVLAKKKVKLTRLGAPSGDDMLKSAGEAILLPDQTIRPCSEGVTYCLEAASGILWGLDGDGAISTADPQVAGAQWRAPCIDTPSPRRVRAKYKDTGRPPIGSDPDGVRQVDLKIVASQSNKIKYKVQLRDVDLTAASGVGTTLRQTIVIGDTCLVLKLVCTPAGTTTAICVPST